MKLGIDFTTPIHIYYSNFPQLHLTFLCYWIYFSLRPFIYWWGYDQWRQSLNRALVLIVTIKHFSSGKNNFSRQYYYYLMFMVWKHSIVKSLLELDLYMYCVMLDQFQVHWHTKLNLDSSSLAIETTHPTLEINYCKQINLRAAQFLCI